LSRRLAAAAGLQFVVYVGIGKNTMKTRWAPALSLPGPPHAAMPAAGERASPVHPSCVRGHPGRRATDLDCRSGL